MLTKETLIEMQRSRNIPPPKTTFILKFDRAVSFLFSWLLWCSSCSCLLDLVLYLHFAYNDIQCVCIHGDQWLHWYNINQFHNVYTGRAYAQLLYMTTCDVVFVLTFVNGCTLFFFPLCICYFIVCFGFNEVFA